MVGYPTKKVKHENKGLYLGNKGMSFEDEINQSNEYYLVHDKAVIHKKPTPIQIVKSEYPSRNKTRITEAYFVTPSTTDYNGIYKGKYIDFEAKETRSKTSFSLSNIHEHQITHLKNVYRHGGISFLIVRFTTINETYLLKSEDLVYYIERTDKKSIPLEFFKEKGYIIKDGLRPRIDYLKIIDNIIGGI